jgi:hypothetical protein
VEVEMVIPPDDPSEPRLESETDALLRDDVQEHAQRGDVESLKRRGRVYEVEVVA